MIGLKVYVTTRIYSLNDELITLESEANEIKNNRIRFEAIKERIAFIHGALEELKMICEEFDIN